MIIPQSLRDGDQIRIISPSGRIDPVYIDRAADVLFSMGFHPVVGRYAKSVHGRYAGTDEERLSDLVDAYQNPDVKAILCSRGGYGVVHLLSKINPDLIRNNPKWLIGYSDITALHALSQNCGIASMHAPMARHLADEDPSDPTVIAFSDMLRGKRPVYKFDAHSLNRNGECNGILRGGNLSVLQGLRGTPFDVSAENTILFIEDIGERPYQVERMMYNLKMSGFFEKISGLIVGQFTDYEEDSEMQKNLPELLWDVISEYDFPVAFGFPVGHVSENMPLLCGCKCVLKINKTPSLSFCLSE